MIALPDVFRDLGLPLIVSVSGGKDSTACMIALREAGLTFRAVFADTGWEAPETYAYLDTLRGIFGPIDVVRAESKTGEPRAMVDRIRYRAGFPARMQRWCTPELKTAPLRAYHDAIGETVNVVGVRALESEARRALPEVEDDAGAWGGWVWRPLISWTERDVYEAHERAGVPLNPLYLRGHDRVGCYPCVFSRKEEIRLIADHAPERIREIADLERWATGERDVRNVEEPGRYSHAEATFFQSRQRKPGGAGIREVVEWSRTSRGGRQLPLLADPPSGGCFRLGFCEAPK